MIYFNLSYRQGATRATNTTYWLPLMLALISALGSYLWKNAGLPTVGKSMRVQTAYDPPSRWIIGFCDQPEPSRNPHGKQLVMWATNAATAESAVSGPKMVMGARKITALPACQQINLSASISCQMSDRACPTSTLAQAFLGRHHSCQLDPFLCLRSLDPVLSKPHRNVAYLR